MEDIINSVVRDYWKRGKGIEAIRKYIRKKYGINIEKNALVRRLKLLNLRLQA